MKRVVIQDKSSPIKRARNEGLVSAIYRELEGPSQRACATPAYGLATGHPHPHRRRAAEGRVPLATLECCQLFRAGIAERCEGPPTVQDSREVGSFRLFASSS